MEASVVKTRLRGTDSSPRLDGFTLVELVVVVLMLGIFVAVAVQRFSISARQAEEAALAADLRRMRDALQFYAAEHNGNYPASLTALARYTSAGGAMSSNKTAFYQYGKYIHQIPPCPVGTHKGATGWGACSNPPGGEAGSPTVGWLYHSASGSVWVNDANYFDM